MLAPAWRTRLHETSPVYAPSGSYQQFWAPTWMGWSRSFSATAARLVNGGKTAQSRSGGTSMPAISPSARRIASRCPRFIFQLPAMSGLRMRFRESEGAYVLSADEYYQWPVGPD